MSVNCKVISCIAIWLVIGTTSEETLMEQLLKAKSRGDVDTCRTAVANFLDEVCDEFPLYHAVVHLFIDLTLGTVQWCHRQCKSALRGLGGISD